ncbi:integrase catalytic domain-containing protein [Trichonephila clavipes]|nr:integrase catalytic domain-containing protein [Trichonephila clavipes]
MNNPDEKDKTHLESKLDTLKSSRIKLSDIRDEYYEVVADDSDLEPLESEILDLEDDCEDIQYIVKTVAGKSFLCVPCWTRGVKVTRSPTRLPWLLGLKCERVNTSICGVNGTPQFIKNKVSTVVSSKNRQFQKLMEFLVVPKITGLTPTNKLDISGIKIPEYIKLSDENFYLPGRIDLLLSNQIFFEILNSGKLKLADGKLILQDTVFGYIASGVMSHNYTKKSYCGLVTNANELNNSIKRFWEIENCPDFEIPTMSREEKLCEEHFTSTYNRDETGRFIVKMPLLRDPSCLGDSKQMALRRLNSLWRRLVQDPKILELYRNFIREYLEMGHMD